MPLDSRLGMLPALSFRHQSRRKSTRRDFLAGNLMRRGCWECGKQATLLRGRKLRSRLQMEQDYFPTHPCCLIPIDRPVFRFPAAFCNLQFTSEGAGGARALVRRSEAPVSRESSSRDLNQGRLGQFPANSAEASVTNEDHFMKPKASFPLRFDRFCFVHLFLSASPVVTSVAVGGNRFAACRRRRRPRRSSALRRRCTGYRINIGRKEGHVDGGGAAAAAAGSVYDPNQTSKKSTVAPEKSSP